MTNLVRSGWVQVPGQRQTVWEDIVDWGAEEYISWRKVVIHAFWPVIDWFAIWYKDKDVNLKCASMIIHLRKGRKCDMEQPLLSTIYLQRHDSCLLSHPIICSYSVILLVILRTVWEPYGTHITTPYCASLGPIPCHFGPHTTAFWVPYPTKNIAFTLRVTTGIHKSWNTP